jgi:preprotein translocase subunit SecA
MFDKIIKALFGSQNERDIKALQPIVEKVNAKEAWASALQDTEFP